MGIKTTKTCDCECHTTEENIQQTSEEFRLIMDWIVVVLALIFAVVFFTGGLWYLFVERQEWIIKVIEKQFASIVMPPLVMGASIFIVSILKIASGPVKFKILGMEFEGSSAPIVMFLIVYMTIISSIQLMWV